MKKYLTLLLVPAALAFVACGNNEATTEVEEMEAELEDVGNDVGAMGTAAMDKMAGMTSINETVDAVRNAGGDITAIPAGAALANVDAWIAKLDGVDGAGEVRNGLKELREELTEGEIDGREVGTILNALAEDTRELAPNNAALAGLAQALEAGGQKLGGI